MDKTRILRTNYIATITPEFLYLFYMSDLSDIMHN